MYLGKGHSMTLHFDTGKKKCFPLKSLNYFPFVELKVKQRFASKKLSISDSKNYNEGKNLYQISFLLKKKISQSYLI